ncbi:MULTISPECIES: bifunctional phosphopantothenoylcysteine decarboxylase/phosphopantothenate--cysteine ligase CoaBC [Clostridium]|jgi:phosphopantothenoylcysteine decarboxylase / phosphopantothenate---cysteine ligase|uniref:bifunctional phosphopantothenoylcysteine decarboxylase/phosphopantothenate--cysteine ligase CoaBC n=1 Tax=Clostridium TaxID=1485 RepID=UPI00232B34BF|nr:MULTISPECIES: bifunctional phosphopantothenoylcysteine decarboxylase/phosphopantothenate--cysteine ligase CoaBC [Clostridium]MBS6501109.1 bifunctional phosphopantothenoylcysteine decarboxylase/phosphopantothenate--cysteine ligase CoaBC [Clostridium sp.]MDB1939387.1 bifunctional phosphopantothenoylcysteine decarboxylase/phosphopantothenate--cysteine ligase CoaBC [Clostridium tertium]MDU2158369.1 bifunctional phosphopantothenoylcysteine decarboxylase/phosphopantothenate--cysteine ligase CoaBC [
MNEKKCVCIGVSGGIAVYKALDIISALKKKDIDVRVIMTESATKFVTPLSFQSLSQNMVVTDMFAEPKAFEIQHISLAKRADVFLVAPATANIIGKVANGISDDMLSTTIMATRAKVIFAPAMNTNMYENPIVQDNIEKLKKYGYEFIEPASGRLACGDLGKGKLADVNTIVEKVLEALNEEEFTNDLRGKNVLVSAGPTHSKIDPVRFITNRSTGKMGYYIAEEAKRRGANVTLVSGPTNINPPNGINVINITTNEEMKNAILDNFEKSDIVIKSAAVADYKAKNYSNEKIKKGEGDLVLTFVRDNDILKILGEKKSNQILVGFAAESNNVLENAKRKLENKNLDYIVANDITSADTGFGSEDNKVIIISKDGEEIYLDKMSKKEVASKIFETILRKR